MSSIRLDSDFSAEEFVALAQLVWPGEYDTARAAIALTKSVNIGARDGGRLVGALRVLTDGYFFACVSEILVDPAYQRRGLGRALMARALEAAPRGKLFLGAQPQSVGPQNRTIFARPSDPAASNLWRV